MTDVGVCETILFRALTIPPFPGPSQLCVCHTPDVCCEPQMDQPEGHVEGSGCVWNVPISSSLFVLPLPSAHVLCSRFEGTHF